MGTPKVSAKQNRGLLDDHDPNDLGQKAVSEERLPQGYDAQRGGTTSGQMDESKRLHDIKDKLRKQNPVDVPGMQSDREGLPIGPDGQPIVKGEKDDMGFPKGDESKFG